MSPSAFPAVGAKIDTENAKGTNARLKNANKKSFISPSMGTFFMGRRVFHKI
jgi:hypothetical protein